MKRDTESRATIDGGGATVRTFLIADVRGYTTFTHEHGDEAGAELAMWFARIARATLEANGGSDLQFRGDEVLAVFTSARRAIRAATALQDAFVAATIADPSLALPVGIGLDAGEAVEVDDGFRGAALNLAARLCAIAGPGEILASQEVVHLAGRVAGISRTDRGSVRLKGIADPVRVSRLTREGWDPDDDEAFQRALGPRAVRSRAAGTAVCPYRGLAAFQPEDADRFFGRESLVAELVDRLDHDRMLFVVGPSGSGKSSVVRAGLIPAVRSGALGGSGGWPVALLSPRSDPAMELSYQLRRVAEAAGLPADALGESHSVLRADQARRLTDSICAGAGGLLMVIDQFEELFTLNQRREQETFLEMLAALTDPAGSRVRAVMAMRADFYGMCATFPWLARRVPANQVLVGPMSRADLRKAIEQPAATVGLRLEEGLVDAVLEEAGSEPAALPLVSHALAETWRRRNGDTLTLAGYREAGGVAGSISQTADSLYETVFDEARQEACRRLMLRLVVPGEGTSDTRRRLPMSDLDHHPDPEEIRGVAAEMIDARLLTVDRDSLEIAHEALLQSWPRLRDWIDKSRDDLRTRQRVTYATAEWEAQDRDPDLLYRGTPLQAALEWAAGHGDVLWPAEQEFLDASRDASLRAIAREEEEARRSRRVRRVAVAVLAVLAVAAVAASILAFSALGRARSSFGQALAQQATFLSRSNPPAAIGLALEAMARGQAGSVDARSALVDASQALAGAGVVPSGSPVSVGDALSIAVSPDGRLIVTGNRDGSISTWDATGASLAAEVPGHAKAIEEMDMTPDGRWLVTGSHDTTIRLWDLADPGAPTSTVLGETGEIVWSVAVAPDGRRVATASEDGSIDLWDLEPEGGTGSESVADLSPDALTVAFSPDGELLLAGNGAGQITGWTVADRRVAIPPFFAHRSDIWEIEFDPSGARFATGSSDGSVRVWDTATSNRVSEPFKGSADTVAGVVFDGGGNLVAGDGDGRLLIASRTGSTAPSVSASRQAGVKETALGGDTLVTLGELEMQIWSRGGEPTALVIPEHAAGAYALAASPDGTRIASGDGEGNVRIFSALTGERELGPLAVHTSRVLGLAFSEDGATVASGGEDGDVTVLDAATGEHLASPPRIDSAINAVLLTEAGLLAASADGVVRIWNGETLEGELGLHPGGATAMAASPTGDVLAVADMNGAVHLWDLGDLAPVGDPVSVGGNAVRDVAWSADGELLATALEDLEVKLWDLSDASDPSEVGEALSLPNEGRAVAFLRDGATLAATDAEGSVLLWDTATGQQLGDPLLGHDGDVWHAVALPGMRFATSAEDGTVRIWDVLDPERACDRARGPIGLLPQAPYLGEGEEPIACVRGGS